MRKKRHDPDILEEYDFSGGVRGKYASRYAEGSNVVVIDPDVAEKNRELIPVIMSLIENQRKLLLALKPPITKPRKTVPAVVRKRAASRR